MKSLFFLMLIFSFNSFAVDFCDFFYTDDFQLALSKDKIRAQKTSKNPKRFTFVEKQMIHSAVAQGAGMKGASREEALLAFTQGGEIRYYEFEDEKRYALVHFYPEGREMGAYFEMGTKAFKFYAKIQDSMINCH